MFRAYLTINSAKLILAFLLLGSISGFVLGQQLHQPFSPARHGASVVQVSAIGSLGSSTASHKVTVALHAAPSGHTAHPWPAEMPSHSKHHQYKDDVNASSATSSNDGGQGVQGNHGGGD